MKTSIIGYPRIGSLRELKFACEKYFRNEITEEQLQNKAAALRLEHWNIQRKNNIDNIPSGDFSFYDSMLDTAVLLNVIPQRYNIPGLSDTDRYFAMARGYQGSNGDVRALPMKKWFNTNYHYMVPEADDNTEIRLVGTKPFDEFNEAKENNIITRPVIIGAFTFLKLTRFTGTKKSEDFIEQITKAYCDILEKFSALGAEWIEFDEPCLVCDMSDEDREIFTLIYKKVLSYRKNILVVCQTYFGDIRDCYKEVCELDFDGIGLDFVEGKKTYELIESYGFPENKTLFAGLINGKNIWKNNYKNTIDNINKLTKYCSNIILSTSCSLLHVPYTIKNENDLNENYLKYFSFAEEKLGELYQISRIISSPASSETPEYISNIQLLSEKRYCENKEVQKKVSSLSDNDFIRLPEFEKREKIQKSEFRLPLLPTTTIGSFPQTADVRENRRRYKKGEITQKQYETFNKQKISECILLQERTGLDVLVHGEFERNDMVEYFGECLDGFIFTQNAWVQSYGTRCVKPPVIWGDISRSKPMTVKWSEYSQSLTGKPVKGMLTGPVTILNWSFPREDISLKECAYQIGIAVREEVLDLEASGIRIIQIDEAALREKLPLRKSDWKSQYLSWAIPAFRLVHSGVKPQTQIHTHMCYSDFSDIITEIDDMDADVITFEASRSDLTILDVLREKNFRTEVGPGVYDIHSPRVPGKDEIKQTLYKMLERIPKEKLWVNPDCGLKTRGDEETVLSLQNLVSAAEEVRNENI